MKNPHPIIHDTYSKEKSRSKSISNPKQSKKGAVTSPQKDKKHVLIKVRPVSKAQKEEKTQKSHHVQLRQKKFYSTSKSKSKSKSKEKAQKQPKQFQSQKKMGIQSPYSKKIVQPRKIKITTPGSNDNMKNEIQECYKKIQNGHYQQAQKNLIRIIRMHPKNFQASYLLGYIAQLKHNNQNAKNHYRFCIKIYSNDLNSHSHKSIGGKDKDFTDLQSLQKLSRCYFYLHIFDTTIDICNKILAKQKSSRIYQLKGKAQLARKKYGPAIDSFTNALALDKNNFGLNQLQGDCYRGIQAYQLALNCYSKYCQNSQCESIRMLEKKAQCFKLLNNPKKQQQTRDKIHKLLKQPINSIKISLISQKKLQNNSQLSSNSTTKSYQLGSLPELRPQNPSIQEIEQIYLKGNVQLSLKMVQKLIQREGYNLQNLYWNSFLLYQVQNYQECQKKLNLAIKQLQDPTLPLVLHTIGDPKQLSIINNLKLISNKLKQLNAFCLTEEQDIIIIYRRKKCLQEALNVFKCRQMSQSQNSSLFNSELTIIMEQNSMVQSNKIHDDEQNSIFMLRYIRKVQQNWCKNKFSLESLQKTTDLAFNLVKIRSKQFSILPMHIIYYTIRQQNNNKTFRQINSQINKMLSEMDKKYPANQANLTISTRNMFDIKFQNKPKVNLFHSVFKNQKLMFNSFKQLHKAIQVVADRAKQQYSLMNEICREVCVQKNSGFGFKMCLKVDKNRLEFIQERVMIRIIQKILRNQIKQKVDKFLDIILVKQGKKIKDYFSELQQRWEQTIEEIVRQKTQKNEQVLCDIYDLIRAKCMFSSVQQIKKVTQDFLHLDSKGKIQMIQITNRLQFKTKDVMLKFRVKDIVGQLQLSLQFQSIQNQFNHGLYQLFRSPFGAFFASIMWFSGFAIRKNEIFYKQKIKWNLKGLQHLKKFIYEEQLMVTFTNECGITSQQLILVDFQVKIQSICCYICTKNHLFLTYDHQRNKIIVELQQPKQKFIIKLVNQNLVVHEQMFYSVQLRVEGSQIFFQLQTNGIFNPILLENSITAETLKLKIHRKEESLGKQQAENRRQLFGQYNYSKQIEQCKKNQKMLIQMLNQTNM